MKLLQKRLEMAVLLVTHDQIEALSLSNRIALMEGGRIVQVGTQNRSAEYIVEALKYVHSQKEGEVSLDSKVKSKVLLFREIMAICEGRFRDLMAKAAPTTRAARRALPSTSASSPQTARHCHLPPSRPRIAQA